MMGILISWIYDKTWMNWVDEFQSFRETMEVDRLDSSTFGLFDLFTADPQSKAFRGFHHAICSGILICRSAWDPASLAIVLKHLIRSRERPESGCPVVCACSNQHLLKFSRHGFLQQALHGLLHGVQFFVPSYWAGLSKLFRRLPRQLPSSAAWLRLRQTQLGYDLLLCRQRFFSGIAVQSNDRKTTINTSTGWPRLQIQAAKSADFQHCFEMFISDTDDSLKVLSLRGINLFLPIVETRRPVINKSVRRGRKDLSEEPINSIKYT